jgi:hypothetical protein
VITITLVKELLFFLKKLGVLLWFERRHLRFEDLTRRMAEENSLDSTSKLYSVKCIHLWDVGHFI